MSTFTKGMLLLVRRTHTYGLAHIRFLAWLAKVDIFAFVVKKHEVNKGNKESLLLLLPQRLLEKMIAAKASEVI